MTPATNRPAPAGSGFAARAGGTCLVRVVHSLFAETDDWDRELEGTETGWPGYFRILRLYLEHFRGLPGASVQLLAGAPAETTLVDNFRCRTGSASSSRPSGFRPGTYNPRTS